MATIVKTIPVDWKHQIIIKKRWNSKLGKWMYVVVTQEKSIFTLWLGFLNSSWDDDKGGVYLNTPTCETLSEAISVAEEIKNNYLAGKN